MAAPAKDLFIEKLSKLNDTPESIALLSHYMIHHRKHAVYLVSLWASHTKTVPAAQKLFMFYLCNDVVQNSRRKGDEYIKAFGDVLKESFIAAWNACPPDIQKKLTRLLDIWKERQVYAPQFIEKCKAAAESLTNPAPVHLAKRPRLVSDQDMHDMSPVHQELFKLLSMSEQSESEIEGLKLKAMTARNVVDTSMPTDSSSQKVLMDRIEDAKTKFVAYQNAIEKAQSYHTTAISSLNEIVSSLRTHVRNDQALLEACLSSLQQLEVLQAQHSTAHVVQVHENEADYAKDEIGEEQFAVYFNDVVASDQPDDEYDPSNEIQVLHDDGEYDPTNEIEVHDDDDPTNDIEVHHDDDEYDPEDY